MKYCKDRAALLSGYVDGTLSRAEELRLRDHLAVCSGCKACLKDLLAIHKNFPVMEDIAVPAGFTASVMNAVRADIARQSGAAEPTVPTAAQMPPKKRGKRLWKVLTPVAACLVLVAALGSQGLLFQDQSGAPAAPAAPRAATADGGASTDTQSADEYAALQIPETAAQEHADVNGPTAAGRSVEIAPKQNIAGDNTETASGEPPAAVMESLPPSQTDVGAPGTFSVETTGAYFAELTLTAAEAGDLLTQFTLVVQVGDIRAYELDRASYDQLLVELAANGVSAAQSEKSGDANGEIALVTVVLED